MDLSKYVDFSEKYWEFERKVRGGYIFKTLEPIYRRYVKWIKAILIKHRNMENNSKISILDIGCGFGYFLKLCDEEGWETYGVDISEYAIGRARSITKAKLFVHDVEKGLPMFNEDFFDIVTMIDVLEHLYSPFKVVKEIYRILKPGGFMIITTPNLNALARFLWKIIGKEKRWYGFIDKTHIHLFTPLSLKHLVEKAGFRIINLKTPFHPLPEILQIALNKTGLGGQIWLVAQKRAPRD